MEKAVLTGNEAVSRGFWEADGVIAYSYPGFPTVDILESLKKYKDIDSEWGTNEKVAFEIAMGASLGIALGVAKTHRKLGINKPIVATRPCALNYKIKEPHFYVDENICISCRSCIRVNCPPISMKIYPGKQKKNSYIDADMCVGCSVCSQVCPVGAIKRSSSNTEIQGVLL